MEVLGYSVDGRATVCGVCVQDVSFVCVIDAGVPA